MKKITLNYNWFFKESFDKKDILDNSTQGFKNVNIPHTNKEIPYNNFDESIYEFISCYKKLFTLDESYKNKRLIVEFGACAHHARVYLNGHFIQENFNGYSAFYVDITDHVKIGENILVVELDSRETLDIPPFGGVIDYLTYGGIYRDVYLHVYNLDYIKTCFLTPVDVLASPKIKLDIQTNNTSSKELVFTVLDHNAKEILNKKIKQGNNTKISETFEINGDITLWDIDNPYLYKAVVIYNEDKYEYNFGFREAVFKRNGFFLNGKNIKLRGLNRHQSFPYVGNAMPKSAQIADAEFLKFDLGLNIVRTAHYPNSQHFLDHCDKIGLLVFTEIPGWQHIGESKNWRKVCVNNVKDMILQDYNHPSIILWGVRINESVDDADLYKKTNQTARELDQSRQTGGVRYIPRSQFLEDVYTFNDFSHAGGRIVTMPKFFVAGRKPYLITEFAGHMYPTKSFDHEQKRREHVLRHARVLSSTYKHKGISGCIGWCMSDYNTHRDFGSGDRICYHGVSDMFRNKKLAGIFYSSQQKKKGVLDIMSNMEIGDVAGGQTGPVLMITNCDTVKLFKNNQEIMTYDVKSLRTKSRKLKYLPNPPIEIRDIIGDQLEKLNRFSKKDANRIKNILLSAKESGPTKAVIKHLLPAGLVLAKNKMRISDIIDLYGQYVTTWGSKQNAFKFVGYIDGKEVAQTTKSCVRSVHYEINADKELLIEDQTYDCTRISIKALSDVGNVLPYSNDVINISVDGPVEIIGPKQISLIGGMRAAWVKTIGKSGDAVITFSNKERNIAEKIKISVKKEKVETL